MAWYDKYMTIYGKPFSEISQDIVEGIRARMSVLQSTDPLVSVVVIAYNEDCRLASCLWSLSELKSIYPLEIIGVNNNSTDNTEEVFKKLGVPYYNEPQQSPGFARKCGLDQARGKYYFCIDADTLYPSGYVDIMMRILQKKEVSCVSSFWSFFPDKNHSRLGLMCYEYVRDLFLYVQHFKRPELSVRGMAFAFKIDYARQVQIRTDIRRGEDGSLALALKKYGKIVFVRDQRCRVITGYGTIGNLSMWNSFIQHVKIQGKGISRVFFKKDHYEDSDDNLVNSIR
jgi:glycosyltransferase involved in cell wall biosynthesis